MAEMADKGDIQKLTKALNQHSKATAEATAALQANIAALKQTTKAHKTVIQQTADAMACASDWLEKAKGVSAVDARNLNSNMSTNFHIQNIAEMTAFLTAVKTCLARKGDTYRLDTTSPQANHHIGTLLSGTLMAVIQDIVSNIS